MKIEERVVIEHSPYDPAKVRHFVNVWDWQSGNLLFQDTKEGVNDWLEVQDYELLLPGRHAVWEKRSQR